MAHESLGSVRGHRHWVVLVIALFLAAGCDGRGLEYLRRSPNADLACSGSGIAAQSSLHRLTPKEYANTLADLFGRGSAPVAVAQLGGSAVTTTVVEKYMEVAEAVSAGAVENLPALLPCNPSELGEEPCAEKFIRVIGKRAFRRPLSEAEVIRFQRVFRSGRAQEDFRSGVQLVIEAMLQSPQMQYRIQLPSERPSDPLSPYEIASRLSYFLWSSMPDAELFAAADAGGLGTAADVELQARRMIQSPRARQAVASFHAQWLRLDRLDALNKDPEVFPAFAGIRGYLRGETEAFLDYVFWETDAKVEAILQAPYTFLNQPLAAFYGVSGPPSEAFERAEIDTSKRTGLLSHAGILALNSKPYDTSPVARGKFVREQILCQILPPPPPGVVTDLPRFDPTKTNRQKLQAHTENASCYGCHRLLDPIGFGFENYDGVGRWRDRDNGLPIDASGEVLGTSDADGPYAGPIALSARLSKSADFHACVVRQWFRYAFERLETEADRCTVERIRKKLEGPSGNLREIPIELTLTESFRYRTPAAPGGSP